jgi:hypothetical protein
MLPKIGYQNKLSVFASQLTDCCLNAPLFLYDLHLAFFPHKTDRLERLRNCMLVYAGRRTPHSFHLVWQTLCKKPHRSAFSVSFPLQTVWSSYCVWHTCIRNRMLVYAGCRTLNASARLPPRLADVL